MKREDKEWVVCKNPTKRGKDWPGSYRPSDRFLVRNGTILSFLLGVFPFLLLEGYPLVFCVVFIFSAVFVWFLQGWVEWHIDLWLWFTGWPSIDEMDGFSKERAQEESGLSVSEGSTNPSETESPPAGELSTGTRKRKVTDWIDERLSHLLDPALDGMWGNLGWVEAQVIQLLEVRHRIITGQVPDEVELEAWLLHRSTHGLDTSHALSDLESLSRAEFYQHLQDFVSKRQRVQNTLRKKRAPAFLIILALLLIGAGIGAGIAGFWVL